MKNIKVLFLLSLLFFVPVFTEVPCSLKAQTTLDPCKDWTGASTCQSFHYDCKGAGNACLVFTGL
jgi:hypothetical protein